MYISGLFWFFLSVLTAQIYAEQQRSMSQEKKMAPKCIFEQTVSPLWKRAAAFVLHSPTAEFLAGDNDSQ